MALLITKNLKEIKHQGSDDLAEFVYARLDIHMRSCGKLMDVHLDPYCSKESFGSNGLKLVVDVPTVFKGLKLNSGESQGLDLAHDKVIALLEDGQAYTAVKQDL